MESARKFPGLCLIAGGHGTTFNYAPSGTGRAKLINNMTKEFNFVFITSHDLSRRLKDERCLQSSCLLNQLSTQILSRQQAGTCGVGTPGRVKSFRRESFKQNVCCQPLSNLKDKYQHEIDLRKHLRRTTSSQFESSEREKGIAEHTPCHE